jgi:hypothetical protein
VLLLSAKYVGTRTRQLYSLVLEALADTRVVFIAGARQAGLLAYLLGADERVGEIVGIEVKPAASIDRRDVRAMEKLRDSRGARFKAGVVVCACEQTIPLGDRLWAVPLSGPWA